jgi:hypothetical protein
VVGKKRRVATMAEKIALGSQQHRDLGPDDTLRLPPAIAWDTDRMVLMDPVSGRCVYYQDKGKRYRFITDAEEGMPLLCDLVTTNRSLLEKNEEIMAQRGDPMSLKQEGYHIYSEKPTLKSAVSTASLHSQRIRVSSLLLSSRLHGVHFRVRFQSLHMPQANVTWSDEEYGHPGLQHMYLRYKSFQRFTETYALLERAEMRSLFSGDGVFTPKADGRPLRVASIGGGPGCAYDYFISCLCHY